MEQMTEFAPNHYLLFSSLGVILVLLAQNLIGGAFRSYELASPQQLAALVNHEDATVLDVRENKEYVDGHILNSIHIPLSELTRRLTELDKFKESPVVICCRSGHRSAQACGQLKKSGFEKIHNLEGGTLAWQDAGLPLNKT
jgi:rhodanese-related sulfurtransferase